MKPTLSLALLLYTCIAACQSPAVNKTPTVATPEAPSLNNDNPYAQIRDIPLPQGFTRIAVAGHSFADWLRKLALKKDKTVFLYNGNKKWNQQAQFAVVDISRGDKDLQQCADAIMRLRAEYFFSENAFDSIHFKDNAGKLYAFTAPYNRAHFQPYLERVFGMCGSASLSKEMKPRKLSDMQIGDVLIRGGFPGHGVIVVDMAVNNKGEKIFMIAQSYMPAQDIQLLKNLNEEKMSPWYKIEDYPEILTPEYTFKNTELRTW